GTQVLEVGRVLHGNDQYLDNQPEGEAEQEEVQAEHGGGRVLVQPGQQEQRHHEHRGADDRVDLVPAGAGDQLPADDRGDQQPADHRQQVQAGYGGRDAVHHLQEQRQVGDR